MRNIPHSAKKMTRVVIAGGPKTGKTTLARKLGSNTRCTDSVRNEKWGKGSSRVASWMDAEDLDVIEGCISAHALRKWMRTNNGKPCDQVIYLNSPQSPRTKRQAAMGKGINKVFREIEPELRKRGVSVSRR